jgi:hypothetical protein
MKPLRVQWRVSMGKMVIFNTSRKRAKLGLRLSTPQESTYKATLTIRDLFLSSPCRLYGRYENNLCSTHTLVLNGSHLQG